MPPTIVGETAKGFVWNENGKRAGIIQVGGACGVVVYL